MLGNNCPNEPKLGPRLWTAWLSVPLGLAVVGVAAWLLTTYAHLPIVATWLVFVAVGWVLYRNAKASVAGVALCVAAVAVAITGYGLTALFGDPEGRIASFLGVLAGIMYLLGGLVFFIASLRNRTRCAGNCAGFMIVFFSIVISAMSACTQRDYRAGPQAIQETRTDPYASSAECRDRCGSRKDRAASQGRSGVGHLARKAAANPLKQLSRTLSSG